MDLDPMTDGSLRKLSDEKIQDFINERLSRRERAVVAATLIANPDLMHEVMRLWLINEMLRCLGQDALLEQVPDKLKHALKSTNPPRGEYGFAEHDTCDGTGAIDISVWTIPNLEQAGDTQPPPRFAYPVKLPTAGAQ